MTISFKNLQFTTGHNHLGLLKKKKSKTLGTCSVYPLVKTALNTRPSKENFTQHCAPHSFPSTVGSAVGPVAQVVNAADLNAVAPSNELVKFADDTFIVVPSNIHTRQADIDNINLSYKDWKLCFAAVIKAYFTVHNVNSSSIVVLCENFDLNVPRFKPWFYAKIEIFNRF